VKRLALIIVLSARVAAAQDPVGYKLDVPEHLDFAVGDSSLPIAIQIERGQSVSKDAGIGCDVEREAGVVVKRRRLARTDAIDPDEDSPRFAIPVRGNAPGDFTLKLHLRFWLCGTKVCRPIDARRTVTIRVH